MSSRKWAKMYVRQYIFLTAAYLCILGNEWALLLRLIRYKYCQASWELFTHLIGSRTCPMLYCTSARQELPMLKAHHSFAQSQWSLPWKNECRQCLFHHIKALRPLLCIWWSIKLYCQQCRPAINSTDFKQLEEKSCNTNGADYFGRHTLEQKWKSFNGTATDNCYVEIQRKEL